MQAIDDGLQRAPERALCAGAERAGAGRGAQARRCAHPRARDAARHRAGHRRSTAASSTACATTLFGRREPSQGSVPSVRPAARRPRFRARRRTHADRRRPSRRAAGCSAIRRREITQAQAARSLRAVRSSAPRRRRRRRHRRRAVDEQLARHVGRRSRQGQRAQIRQQPGDAVGSRDASGSDLARQAGINDIGRSAGKSASRDDSGSQRAGLFDSAANDSAPTTTTSATKTTAATSTSAAMATTPEACAPRRKQKGRR